MFTLLLTLFFTFLFKKFIHYYKGPVSDHYDGKTFFNPEYNYGNKKTYIKNFLKWKFLRKYIKGDWPKSPVNVTVISEKMQNSDELRVTYIGHSSFLLQISGINILLDPVWTQTLGVWPVVYKRAKSPGITLEALPKIDFVFVSHSHYDHCDISTLEKIAKVHSPKIIVPLGVDFPMKKIKNYSEIVVLDWHQSFSINEPSSINFCLEPAHHWSSRYLVDSNKSLWASLVIQVGEKNIYFAGDTAYAEGKNFALIREKYKNIDLAFLPIGAYEPRIFLESVHMNPEEAVKAAKILEAKTFVPMHYDTFKLANESYGQAIEDLKKSIDNHSLTSNLQILNVGEPKYL